MADFAGAPSASTLLRWMSLVAVAANFAFLSAFDGMGGFMSLAALAARQGPTLFPARVAYGLAGFAILGLALFLCVAVRPRRRPAPVYDVLSIGVALASVLATAWVVAFRNEAIDVAFALVAASALLGCAMLARIALVSPSRYSGWLRVPFSLYVGALCLALLAALSYWVHARGLEAHPIPIFRDSLHAGLMLIAITSTLVALCLRDFIVPLVIAGGMAVVYLTHRESGPALAADAVTVGAGMLIVAGVAGIAYLRAPRRPPKAAQRNADTAPRGEPKPPARQNPAPAARPVEPREPRAVPPPAPEPVPVKDPALLAHDGVAPSGRRSAGR